MPNSARLLTLQHIAFDELDFNIMVAEAYRQIPFAVKRVYWLQTGNSFRERGNHAHLNSEQFIVSIVGDINAYVTDIAGNNTDFILSANGQGLYIPPKHWLRIEMPPQAVLLCLSSHNFDEQETVYDLDEFLFLK